MKNSKTHASIDALKNYVNVLSQGPSLFAANVYSSLCLVILMIFLSGIFVSCDEDNQETWEIEVEELKTAIAPYKEFDAAVAGGYDVDGTGYRTGMGHHYLKASLVDNAFEHEKPEVLLFVPDDNGEMEFVAVEYLVPIADLNNPQPAPDGFTGGEDVWEINTEFSMWTLHVWIEMENPEGLFSPMNPLIP